MTIDDVDLNLLRVLDALLREGSVQGAAARLHLSPPAVSRALGRLRRVIGDPLFVRSGRNLASTPRADALRSEVAALMEQIAVVLTVPEVPDPSTLERRFRIRADDAILAAIALPLLRSLEHNAPLVDIDFLPELREPYIDLRTTDTDLTIGVHPEPDADIDHQPLLVDRFVAAVRRGHHLTTTRLTAERCAAAHHLNVSPRARRDGPIDSALAEIGLRRTRVTTITSFVVAAHLVATTDLVGNLPSALVRSMGRTLPITTLDIPVPLPTFTISQSWHQRHTNDAAHRFLRESVANTMAQLVAET